MFGAGEGDPSKHLQGGHGHWGGGGSGAKRSLLQDNGAAISAHVCVSEDKQLDARVCEIVCSYNDPATKGTSLHTLQTHSHISQPDCSHMNICTCAAECFLNASIL